MAETMTIKATSATVYVGNGRRYLTLKAACRAEAKGIWRRMLAAEGEPPDDHWDKDQERIDRVAGALARRFRRRALLAAAKEGK